ncbi:hypothetical protein [Actinomycetospora flava]|uniref:CHAT domain-containing protein n=1 Tax=Actinomycetospora flava TaxID=3129232 RepID=A0ABU8MF59_9PSEU
MTQPPPDRVGDLDALLLRHDVVLLHQLVETMQLRGEDVSDPEFSRAVDALRHVRNRIVHGHSESAVALDEEARAAVNDILGFLSHLEQSSLGAEQVRSVRRLSAPSDISEIMSRQKGTAARKEPTTMSSDQYRRQLQRKREQQVSAEKNAGDARRKEAAKRADAAKSRSSATSTKNATTARSRLREAERHEDNANKAAKDAAYWSGKAAGYLKDAANIEKRLIRAEQAESSARERAARSEALASQRRITRDHDRIERRVLAAEQEVAELRTMRPPKPERLRVLMLAASSQGDLRVDREQRRVKLAVQGALHRDLVEIDMRMSATPSDLLDGLTTFRPHVVHFSGHSDEDLIVFEDDVDAHHEGVVVAAETFARALSALDSPPLLVMLNSCHSASQADTLVDEDVVPFAIGMSDEVKDQDAIEYAARFYASIANGSSLRESHLMSQTAVALAGSPGGTEIAHLAHAYDVDPANAKLVVPPAT